jgi:dienelactone hydrolase
MTRWALVLAGGLLLAGCRPPGGAEAVRVLEDLAAEGGPSRLKERTEPPVRRKVTFTARGEQQPADLYVPAGPSRAGLVLVPGLAERGRRDPRLVALARTLARVGFRVLVPDLPGLRVFEVRRANVADVAAAYRALGRHTPPRLADHRGIAAFSYAAGPAVLAALEPGLRERVGYVVAVGGYYDLEAVITFLTTGAYRTDGGWRHAEPHPYAKWAFVLSNAELVPDARDRRFLERLAREKLHRPGVDVSALAANLGEGGRAVYRLVTNGDRERVPALLAELPAPLRRDLAALDLANKDLSRLRARLLLLHGPDDRMIPVTQSRALAAAVPAARVDLFEVAGLAHVDVEPGRLDRRALARAVGAVLAQRAPAP